MKKTFILLSFLILLSPNLAFGQVSNTDNTSDPNTDVKDKVDQIKDKVTSKVEKLNLVEKRGMAGTVESVSNNQIKINDINDKIRIIEVDELTKYSSNVNSFNLSSIKQGIKISAIGIYNKESEKLLARFVNEISIPIVINGVIIDRNEDDFTVTIATEDEKKYSVDIENITKTYSFSDEKLSQSGFRDIKNLQNAIVMGFNDENESNKISATKIIIFPDIPKNPRINVTLTKDATNSSNPSSPTPEK